MLKMMMPVISGLFIGIAFKAGRKYGKECKATRIDIEKQLIEILKEW